MSNSTIGERLRSARESIPASIYQASRETKIRPDFIELMERDNFRFMSGSTYIKGLLRSYARYLGMRENEVLGEFDRVYGDRPGPSVAQLFKEPASKPKIKKPRWVIAAVLAASTLMVLSLIGLVQPSSPDVAPPPRPEEVAVITPSPPSSPDQVAALPPQYEGVQLTISVVGKRCWLRVEADGNANAPVFQGTLFEGATQTFQGNDQLKVTFGDIGAVRVMVNGRDLDIQGESGQVGTFIFTRDAMTSLSRG